MNKEAIIQKFSEYKKDAYKFVLEVLMVNGCNSKGEPDERSPRVTKQQKEALDAISKLCNLKIKLWNKEELSDDERNYALKTGLSIMAARGVGKDAFAAWVIIWFTVCFKKCKNMATAPTEHQLKDVLWSEIAKWLAHARDNGNDWLSSQIEMRSDKLFLIQPDPNENGKRSFTVCRTASAKASKDEMAETLSGLHEDNMLILADEASGLSDPIFKPLEGTLTGKCNIMIVIFNPTRNSGQAIKNHTEQSKYWVTLNWPATECDFIQPITIEKAKAKYGTDSDVYRVDILGMPPKQDEGTLIPYEWCKMAVNRDVEPDKDNIILGADIGRSGDASAICVMQGMKVLPIYEFEIPDLMQITGHVANKIDEFEPTHTIIDALGIGYGVCDRLRERGYKVRALNVAESASMDKRFFRLRDELWWKVREWFEKGLISIPDDNELIDQLSTIRYEVDSLGRIKIESKKQLKSRGKDSPNKADSLMSCAAANTNYYKEKREAPDAWEEAFNRANEVNYARGWMVA